MRKTIVAIFFLYVLLPDISSVKAATNATTILSGGVSLRANYNIRKTEAETTDGWDAYASANLYLLHRRQAKNGDLSISYGQSFSYNFRTAEDSFADSDLLMNINTWRNLSSRLRFNLSDTLIRSIDWWADNLSSTATGIPDDPLDEDGEDTIDDNTAQTTPTFSSTIGRQKFWTNSFSTSLDYQTTRNSAVTLYYNNRILKYDEPDQNNYKYNRAGSNISYSFYRGWNTSLSYSYTDADFDITEDYIGHDVDFNLNYVHSLSLRDSISAGLDYHYNEKNYDIPSADIPIGPSDYKSSYYSVGANLGWTHAFSPRKRLSMSAGPTYLKRDDDTERISASFNINYTSQFENGSWFVGANGGFSDNFDETRYFDRADEGLSEYQSINTGVSWQVAKDLSASLGASIRNDSFLENPLASDEKTYLAFGNISYSFWRWFYVSGRYVYTNVQYDPDANDYQEHRFFITLGTSRELYRWIH